MKDYQSTIQRFKEITEALSVPQNWQSISLLMEIYEREPGNGFTATYVNSEGEKSSIDADVQYNFMFNFEIFSWHKETSIGENRWNKAEFTVNKNGTYEVKTWWDADLQKSLYGDED